MKKIYFTPGPTQIYPQVQLHIEEAIKSGICSISHRGRDFGEIFENTTGLIKKLLGIPDYFHIFFLGSATEAMERIIENCVEKHCYHFVNGAFSKRFFLTSCELKKYPEKTEANLGEGFDFSKVDIAENMEMVCLTQNETGTGVLIPESQISELKKKYPEKLFAVDIVSSVPYVNMDYSLIDCAFFSVQKGFGMPAGLGVAIANDKMMEKSRLLQKNNYNIGSYHNFPSLLKSAEKSQTPETPNVLAIYVLGKICKDILEIGIGRIRKETDIKAKMMYDFFESSRNYEIFVKDPNIRSKTVAVIDVLGGSKGIISRLSENGFAVGSGYGELREKQIRIANFPMHSIQDVKNMLSFM